MADERRPVVVMVGRQVGMSTATPPEPAAPRFKVGDRALYRGELVEVTDVSESESGQFVGASWVGCGSADGLYGSLGCFAVSLRPLPARAPEPDEAERVARDFMRSYEAFNPYGRGQAQYPTPAQARAIEAQLAEMLRAAERRGWERGVEEGRDEGIRIGEAHENERIALYVGSLLGDDHAVPGKIRALATPGPRKSDG